MRIRATASATPRSNAIGVVELDCTPHGLLLGFLGLGSFSEGYVPGALTSGVQLTVPWSSLKQARAEGDQVYLELDWPGLPHDRLTLTRFTLGNRIHPLELRRQRLVVQLSAVAAAALASIVSAAVVPRLTTQATAALTLSVGAAAAFIVLAVGFFIDQRLLGSPIREATIRSAFVAELESYFPQLVRTATAPAQPSSRPKIPDLTRLFPRTTTAVAITLAAGIIAAVSSTRHLLRPPSSATAARSALPAPERPAPDSAAASLAAARPSSDEAPASDAARTSAQTTPSAPRHPDALTITQRCTCQRASSPLWEEAIPTLSLLILDVHQSVRRNRTRTQVDVAVVNNGNQPLHDITLHVTFHEGEGNERRESAHRPLYFEGPLGPGRAIKWRTEAVGTHWEVSPPWFGELETDGSNAAPASAFRELLDANHRPVRLHAARMLAFLGDSAAAQATLQLKDALRSAEAPYLRRLMAALADIRVCDVHVGGEGPQRRVEACVYNGTDQDRDALGVQLVALDRALAPDRPVDTPPTLLGDRRWPLPEPLPAHSGVLVQTTLDLSVLSAEGATAFEMHADRFDLLD